MVLFPFLKVLNLYLLASTCGVIGAVAASAIDYGVAENAHVFHGDAHDDVLVPVVLGVMSMCPDALACESVFDQVLKKVSSKVDISLVYIGQIDESEPDFGVKCLHGAQECAGNVQQLCAQKYAPVSRWWEFVNCQNYQGRYKVGLPDIALKCASSAQLDWKNGPIGQCAGVDGSGKGEEGISLLQESVLISQGLGIEKSCTVIINGEKVCIRDDGTWKECENGHTINDFVKQINAEYERLNAH
ncbi:hypothetical protein FISHEDRAFT_65248 [Fistulina hepatica ATCC 64428]|nr:hypothetical protein FISHEDRAFT_65248 [Fistulina hepatica ATCC 64428]